MLYNRGYIPQSYVDACAGVVTFLTASRCPADHPSVQMPESVEVLSPHTHNKIHISTLPRRRAVGLKLNLDPLGSLEERMPKRCKLDNLTVPYTAPVSAAMLPPVAVRAMSPKELSIRLLNSKPSVLLLDCRPFLAHNNCHIQDSVNVNCTDRLNRRRLQQGKVNLLDLVSSKDGKELFHKRMVKEIVVYDDHTDELSQLSSDNALHLVLTTLLREGKDAYVLKGGLSEFSRVYPELCQTMIKEPEHRPLYSPTTPMLIEPAIETATASEILPFLYLGNERDAANLQRLRGFDITYVLNVTSHIPIHFESQGITYKRLTASDSGQQNLRQYFQEAIEFIELAREKGGKILIHCQAGVSRSATITIAYILKHSLLTMIDAYKLVKSRRQIISPNLNFMGQLLEYEKSLNQEPSLRTLKPPLPGLPEEVL